MPDNKINNSNNTTTPATKAKVKRVNFVNIPQELKSNASFCLWKYEKRSGRATKVPYDPRTGQMARTNDTSTFSDFSTAMTAYAMGGWDGIGYRVSEGIGAIDIDHCIRDDGSLNDVAASILSFFPDAYFERSPSSTGLRGFFKLSPDFAYDKTVYYINNRKHGLEVYLPGTTNRFVTVTGDVYRPGSVARNDEALQSVLDTFMKRTSPIKSGFSGSPVSYFTDEQVIKHASDSASGDKFKALMEGRWEEGYDSRSDADMALVSMLAFWCGCVEEQIDRIFRSSGLMRDKWDRMTGDATYGQITIRNAIHSCSEIYRPVITESSPEDEFKSLDIESIQDERDRREREGYSFTPDLRCLDTSIESLSPHTNPRYESFQIGNAKMFVDYFRRIILMNDTRGCWYIYDGRVWRPDTHNLRISEMAKDFHDILLSFAATITSEDTRTRFLKRVEQLDQKKFRDIMIKDAGNDTDIAVRMEAFDRDKYLFNCHNGTIDLRTMEFKPHSPSDYLTKLSDVDYAPDATCPRWISFMDEVFEGDKDRIRYLQKAIGYAMSGDTRLECMFILYGPTSRNGKGTTMETVLRILGEYGRTAKPEMLSKKGFADSSGPSEDVARLNGARMVNVSEPEKSMVVDASLTKQMTGNNTLTARYLRENSFEFKPQFKLFIDTNHLPQISDMTLFESDRIRIIPFNRHFTAEERDIDLKSFFAEPANLSGILNWCLEGFLLYQDEGLKMPGSVASATADYRAQSDRITMFTNQCIQKQAGQELRSSAIYNRYKDWCAENGFKYENAANFKKKMAAAGFVYMVRRPWNEQGTPTPMVNDVTWAAGEEHKPEFVPEE
ncbi:phage/plasmid primase, P4 family [Candidatus Pseudoruminococcus sp.]|uniref:phage/plasmid primase, P4 family n=1 Tax=Candidatus Pseudoruminococcus sp. TaxID=3101048 RepID=UPI00399BDA9A